MPAGNRNGSWSVELPAEEVPPELPEPCLGINFARDGMARKDWLALVAVHSDAWLMAVAFFYAVKLDAAGRWVGCAGMALGGSGGAGHPAQPPPRTWRTALLSGLHARSC